jgi:hypothetical protein
MRSSYIPLTLLSVATLAVGLIAAPAMAARVDVAIYPGVPVYAPPPPIYRPAPVYSPPVVYVRPAPIYVERELYHHLGPGYYRHGRPHHYPHHRPEPHPYYHH